MLVGNLQRAVADRNMEMIIINCNIRELPLFTGKASCTQDFLSATFNLSPPRLSLNSQFLFNVAQGRSIEEVSRLVATLVAKKIIVPHRDYSNRAHEPLKDRKPRKARGYLLQRGVAGVVAYAGSARRFLQKCIKKNDLPLYEAC
jgi:hypothetical protein